MSNEPDRNEIILLKLNFNNKCIDYLESRRLQELIQLSYEFREEHPHAWSEAEHNEHVRNYSRLLRLTRFTRGSTILAAVFMALMILIIIITIL